MKRWLLVLLLFAVPRTAEARVAIANTGKTIWHLGDAPAEYAMHGMRDVGFMYERYGVFWLDFWRSDGMFVAYAGDTYVPITDEDAARAGLRTPWSYHVPIGLVLVAIVLVFGLVVRDRPGSGEWSAQPRSVSPDLLPLWWWPPLGLANLLGVSQRQAGASGSPSAHMTENLADGTVATASSSAPSP